MEPELLVRGRVEGVSSAVTGQARLLQERLLGPALVRFAESRWGGDVSLGLRMRERHVRSLTRAPGDQDVLFVSRALLRPRVADYLAVDYLARRVLELEGGGRFHLKLVASKPTPLGTSRRERLQTALWDDDARFVLHARSWPSGAWAPLARLRLDAVLEVPRGGMGMQLDVRACGRGLLPVARWPLLGR